MPAPYATLWLSEDGAGALSAEVGLGESVRLVEERMLEVDVEDINGGMLEVDVEEIDGVGVLSEELEELVLEIVETAAKTDAIGVLCEEVEELMLETAARTVDDLETFVITVIVE